MYYVIMYRHHYCGITGARICVGTGGEGQDGSLVTQPVPTGTTTTKVTTTCNINIRSSSVNVVIRIA